MKIGAKIEDIKEISAFHNIIKHLFELDFYEHKNILFHLINEPRGHYEDYVIWYWDGFFYRPRDKKEIKKMRKIVGEESYVYIEIDSRIEEAHKHLKNWNIQQARASFKCREGISGFNYGFYENEDGSFRKEIQEAGITHKDYFRSSGIKHTIRQFFKRMIP